MGRYYDGDIEGKWWFGVQPSDVPTRFGGGETRIEYSIPHDDDFKDTMKEIETNLGDKIGMFDDDYQDFRKKLVITKSQIFKAKPTL